MKRKTLTMNSNSEPGLCPNYNIREVVIHVLIVHIVQFTSHIQFRDSVSTVRVIKVAALIRHGRYRIPHPGILTICTFLL